MWGLWPKGPWFLDNSDLLESIGALNLNPVVRFIVPSIRLHKGVPTVHQGLQEVQSLPPSTIGFTGEAESKRVKRKIHQ